MLESRLCIQAAVHDRSVEDEARDILRSALSREPTRKGGLVASIGAQFALSGGVELPVVLREPMREPPYFEG